MVVILSKFTLCKPEELKEDSSPDAEQKDEAETTEQPDTMGKEKTDDGPKPANGTADGSSKSQSGSNKKDLCVCVCVCVCQCIESVVGGDDYSQSQVNKWTASIVERCLTQLVKQGKPYKYIVTCAVMQKTGAGLHTANSCYWDTAMDGSCTVRWENRTMYCVVSVFAVAIA
ncbi:dynein light chain Tctex-type 1-like [Morone saxatilis]|uniref:dynein light chain Tctex-type 1-like n=1 Tax=Morone saxatilis TaxID=34816 RepID=UPI0015E22D2C|nr:dynein light chain Tctex-type 1-like [Morone saxatilis]